MALTISEFGRLMAAKRDGRGVRAAAAEAGVSSATFSRVENGNMPDLETFAKLCKWLQRDPREFLGMAEDDLATAPPAGVVHFKKKRTVKQETAAALGELILAAQRAVRARDQLIGS
ncbi:MAG TPA: helix-turn-helix transcriptional regulator [Gemmataceae bacterium]|nr:helix-turn-helix transcriptional regulator [Gemmataceae bacterium]